MRSNREDDDDDYDSGYIYTPDPMFLPPLETSKSITLTDQLLALHESMSVSTMKADVCNASSN